MTSGRIHLHVILIYFISEKIVALSAIDKTRARSAHSSKKST